MALHPCLQHRRQLLRQTVLYCLSQRPRTRGLRQPGLGLPVSAPVSFFGLFTTVVCTLLLELSIHLFSSLNLLNDKKQVTAEALYPGWLIKVVSIVKTVTCS